MKLIECNACGYRMENPAEAAERDMAAWREKYNDAVADRVAAERKLAKVLEELEEIRHEASECGSFMWIEEHADQIIKEARDGN